MTEPKPRENYLERLQNALEGVQASEQEELVTAVESLARTLRYRTIQEGEQ